MIIALLLTGVLLTPQAKDSNPYELVRCLCGKLVIDHELPQKKRTASPQHKRKSMHRESLTLFPRQEKESCCDNRQALVTVQTDRFGIFEMKGVQPGLYWLAVPSRGQKAFTPVRFEPLPGVRPSSEDYTFVLNDAGELKLEVTIVLE